MKSSHAHSVIRYSSPDPDAPEVWANQDHLPPTDDKSDRKTSYTYVLRYGLDGVTDYLAKDQDWEGVGGEAVFPPRLICYVRQAVWQAANSFVTIERVKALDAANAGQ